MSLFSTKPMARIMAESESDNSLRRSLGPLSLISLGVGGIIGAGIFTMTGVAAATNAGPGLVISFVLAAIGCVFAGLCYSEFATMIPIAGSAYTYAYATMGELIAWIIGWNIRWARLRFRLDGRRRLSRSCIAWELICPRACLLLHSSRRRCRMARWSTG
jgi:amino acid permease